MQELHSIANNDITRLMGRNILFFSTIYPITFVKISQRQLLHKI